MAFLGYRAVMSTVALGQNLALALKLSKIETLGARASNQQSS
jgi:hypothetical protein